MSKIEDIRQLSDDQLQEQLVELKKEQMNLRFQAASGQLEGTARVREVRRNIARIKTVKNQRRDEVTASSASAQQ